MRTGRVDRLARREERATVKRIFYLSAISLVLAVLVFVFGIPALGKIADFTDKAFNTNEQTGEKDTPVPPSFDTILEATNSPRLKVSGLALGAKTVDIYLDSEKDGSVQTEGGKFEYEITNLKSGENVISAKSVSESGGESDFSESYTVIFDNKEPKLEISSPAEGQTFFDSNRIKVTGTTDKDAQVYANGFLANINAEGKFEVFVPVGEGETTIEIKAIDEAGNVKVENRKVTYRK